MLPYDERMQAVVGVAVTEVRRQMDAGGVRRGYLRAGHLALALLHDPEIARLLDSHGVTAKFRRAAELGARPPLRNPVEAADPPDWEVCHTLDATVVQSIAEAETKRIGHPRVTPLHLALAFVLDETSLASQALIESGRDAEIRADLLAILETLDAVTEDTAESPKARLERTRAAVVAANHRERNGG